MILERYREVSSAQLRTLYKISSPKFCKLHCEGSKVIMDDVKV